MHARAEGEKCDKMSLDGSKVDVVWEKKKIDEKKEGG
jgi:hypothetical protein